MSKEIRKSISGIEWYIIVKAINRNVTAKRTINIQRQEKKLEAITYNAVLPFTSDEVLTNLSKYTLSGEEKELLRFGLNNALPPIYVNKTDVLLNFEMISKFLCSELINKNNDNLIKTELSHLANIYHSKYKPNYSTIKKYRIIKKLRNNNDIIIVRPDKGNGVVIIDKVVYLDKMYELVNDNTKYKLLNNDPTKTREVKLQNYLRSLKKKGFFDKETYEKVYPVGSQPSRLYGLPKIHKMSDNIKLPPFRPICSSISSYNYNLAKYLTELTTPLIPKQHSVQDTFTFVREIQNLRYDRYYLCSYDVSSLFTSIPLKEVIDIAVDKIFESKPDIKISRNDLIKLFMISTAETHFQFNGQMYDQIDGVAMGSPLAPALANLFLGHYEDKWIHENNDKVRFYKRYVDDIFCILNNEVEANAFLSYLNIQHPNIKFTIETEKCHKLAFLDVSIYKGDTGLYTSVFKKPTDTGLLTNFNSYTWFKYKIGLVKSMIDRIFKINNTKEGFDKDIKYAKFILQKNGFPAGIIDRNVNNYLENTANTVTTASINECKYFKLPFIGDISKHAENKIKQLLNQYCKVGSSIRIAFTPIKLYSFFSLKDQIPDDLKSHVVYKFSCAGCDSSYVGYTSRYFTTRIDEHLKSDKQSHVFKHLQSSSNCRNKCSNNCFVVLDTAKTKYSLRIKESMWIKWLKPLLNVQKENIIKLNLYI